VSLPFGPSFTRQSIFHGQLECNGEASEIGYVPFNETGKQELKDLIEGKA
jgi:hypothetical protein